MKQAKNIEKHIKDIYANKLQVSMSAKADKKILTNLMSVLEELKNKKSAESEPRIWRMIMRSRITKFATAAVIITAVIIGINQLGSSSIVWADVLEQIRTFRPYVYKQTIRYESKPDNVKQVMHLSLSRRREIWPDGSIWVFDMSQKPVRILTLYPEKKEAIEKTLLDMGPAKDPDLLRIIAARQDGTEEDLGTTKINGHSVKVFHSPDKINDFTVWADIKTGLPIRIELFQEQLKRNIIMENLEFDVNFDESLFSIIAPQGYNVRKVESKGETGMVSVQQMIERSTFETYILTANPSWTRPVQIMEATDPVSSGHRIYVFAAIADDGRHLVLAQSQTFNETLGSKIKEGNLVYTAANGFKVWGGGPDKWYSGILLKSARDVIIDPPSEERVGYILESPAGTFPVLAVNGPITDEELHGVVESLVPAKEYKTIDSNATLNKPAGNDREKLLDMALKISGKKLTPDEKGKTLRMLSLNEKDLIKGLGVFLELSDGRYPNSLDPKAAIKQADSLLTAKYGSINQANNDRKKELEEKVYDIFFASAFYDKLVRERKDVAYYGDKITVEGSDKVLLRWKISDDQYRVVFGNLTRKSITAEELAELERRPSQ